MFKGVWLQQVLLYSLCIIAFAIPLPFILSSLAIVFTSIVWLLQVNGKQFIANLKKREIVWLWLLFFLFHAISYCYSIDKQESLFDLQKKVSFVVLPIVIGSGLTIDRKKLERIFVFFISGVTIAGIFFISRAFYVYKLTGLTGQFFYHPLIHGSNSNAIYQALYALFAISLLLFFAWQNKIMKIIKVPLFIFLVIFFILLSSRTLIAVFFIIILPLYLRYLFLQKKRDFVLTFALFMLFLSLAVGIFETNNPIKKRYSDVISQNEKIDWKENLNNKNASLNNLSLRLFLWRLGIENMNENHLWLVGAGNGSIYALQNKKLAEYGISDIDNIKNRSPLYNINLHNMYMQVLMMLGIFGLLLFLIIVLSPLSYIRTYNNKSLLAAFNLAIAILMLQESSLQTQAGIVYYTFFSMLFYSNSRTGTAEETNE